MRSLYYSELRSEAVRRGAAERMPILVGLGAALAFSLALWAAGIWLGLQLWLVVGHLAA